MAGAPRGAEAGTAEEAAEAVAPGEGEERVVLGPEHRRGDGDALARVGARSVSATASMPAPARYQAMEAAKAPGGE